MTDKKQHGTLTWLLHNIVEHSNWKVSSQTLFPQKVHNETQPHSHAYIIYYFTKWVSLNCYKTLVQLYITTPRLWQEKHKPKTHYSSSSRTPWAMHARIPSGMTTLRCDKQGTKKTYSFAIWNHTVITTNEVMQSSQLYHWRISIMLRPASH